MIFRNVIQTSNENLTVIYTGDSLFVWCHIHLIKYEGKGYKVVKVYNMLFAAFVWYVYEV